MIEGRPSAVKLAMVALIAATVAVLMVPADASALTTSISPAQVFSETINAEAGDVFQCWWDTTGDVRFRIVGPGNVVLEDREAISGWNLIDVDQTGAYTISWENLEAQDVTLSYDLSITSTWHFDESMSTMMTWMFWSVVVGGIVIAAVVIVVILVLAKADQGKRPYYCYPPYQQPVLQYAPPITATTVCPKCSNPIDAYSAFCSKCGNKLR